MKVVRQQVILIIAYLLLSLLPLLVLLMGPRPAGREFWRDFSVALGFVGLSLMGMQSIPTRMPLVRDVFPMDTIYYFHHRISILSLALVAAHPLILFLHNPYVLRLLNVLTSPRQMQVGVLAVLSAILLVALSVWRKRINLRYEAWRITHGLLTTLAVGLAYLHIFGVGYYLSSPVQKALWLALGAFWVVMLIYARVIKPWMSFRRPYKVAGVKAERGDTYSLALVPEGHAGLQFRAGQVAWLSLRSLPFCLQEHPFSFSSSAAHPERLEFSIRELGDMTSTIKYMNPGDTVYLDGPYGIFTLEQHPAPGYVLLGGGIGAAPFMSMLRTMRDRNDHRPVWFFYGNRTWDTVTFREELEQVQAQLNLHLIHVLERPHEGWTGEAGYITGDMLKRYLPENYKDLKFMICGPLPMILAMERTLRQLHVPLSQIHSEQYEMA